MNSKEKIFDILYKLKEKSELSPNDNFFVFKFTPLNFIGSGPTKDEEINILLKLEKEKLIKIIIPNELEEGIVRSEKSLLNSLKGVQVELLSSFDEYYKKYKKDINHSNKSPGRWNYVNPFWLFWQLLILAWKHKIISEIVGGLIVAYFVYFFGWV